MRSLNLFSSIQLLYVEGKWKFKSVWSGGPFNETKLNISASYQLIGVFNNDNLESKAMNNTF